MQTYGLTTRSPTTLPSQPPSGSAKPRQRRRPNGWGSGMTLVRCGPTVVRLRWPKSPPARPLVLLVETVKAELNLVGLRVGGQQVRGDEVGHPGGDARVHDDGPPRRPGLLPETQARLGRHGRDVDQQPAPVEHHSLRGEPAVGDHVDNHVGLADRCEHGLGLVKVDIAEAGAGIGPAPALDNGPSGGLERLDGVRRAPPARRSRAPGWYRFKIVTSRILPVDLADAARLG